MGGDWKRMRHPREGGDPSIVREVKMGSRVRGNDEPGVIPAKGGIQVVREVKMGSRVRGNDERAVIPAKAGIQVLFVKSKWVPACAGMTM